MVSEEPHEARRLADHARHFADQELLGRAEVIDVEVDEAVLVSSLLDECPAGSASQTKKAHQVVRLLQLRRRLGRTGPAARYAQKRVAYPRFRSRFASSQVGPFRSPRRTMLL